MDNKLKNLRVLVVEDSAPILAMTVSLLYNMGCEKVYRAQEGREGFEMFVAYNPDFVITDLMMEPVDGLALVNLIRRDNSSPNKYVPIMIMSSFGDRMHVELARDSGITEFIAKPFTPLDLQKRMIQIMNKPRNFVETPSFFGPDRRRREEKNFDGPARRQFDGDGRIPAPRRLKPRQAPEKKDE